MRQTYRDSGLQEQIQTSGRQIKQTVTEWRDKAMANPTVAQTVEKTKAGLKSLWSGFLAASDAAARALAEDYDDENWQMDEEESEEETKKEQKPHKAEEEEEHDEKKEEAEQKKEEEPMKEEEKEEVEKPAPVAVEETKAKDD